MLKIDDIINYSLSNNLEYATISDNDMFSTQEFINKCNKNNLKPLISLSINIEGKELVLFAKNYDGYKSLIKLSTIKSREILSYEDLKNSIPGILSVAAITGMSSPTKTAASKSAILVAPAWNMATNLSRYGIFREYLLNAHRLRVYKSA